MQKSSNRDRASSASLCRRASERVAQFLVEGLEQRVCLSSAIAAFGAQQTFATGAFPHELVASDVNGDGKTDLVVAEGTSVGVLLGNGNGTFHALQTFATTKSNSVAVSDLNGDGKPDLIVTNYTSNTVGILFGNGNGSFQAQTTFAVGTRPSSVAVSDVNRDGKPDLIVVNNGANNVGVLLGNGNGTFQAQQTFATGTVPGRVVVSDVNGDGKPDLIVENYSSNSVSVLLGNGNGTFQAQATFGTGTKPVFVTTSDVNGDGRLDLLVTNEGGNNVSVLLGNGNGTFQAQTTFAAGTKPRTVIASDINGDGKPDMIVTNYGTYGSGNSNVAVLLGNGNGTFQAQVTFATGKGPYSVAAADVNGDGRPDLIVSNLTGNSVSVLLGDVPSVVLSINRSVPAGPTTSAPSVSFTVTFSEPVTGVDATDFVPALNGVTTNPPVVVTGSGSSYTVTVNGISGTGTLGLNLADDGSIRNAAGNPLQTANIPLFQPQQTFAAPGSGDYISSADLNGDGKPDLVVATQNPSVLLGNGNGTFQSPVTYAAGAGASPYSLAVADVNGDGKLDLIDANWNSNNVGVLLGNGNGTFHPQVTFNTGSLTRAVVTADVNNDGKPDLIVSSDNNKSFSVLLGNGNGTFQAPVTFATAQDSFWITAADVNNDGKVDVVAVNETFGIVSVLLGNGNGTFKLPMTLAAGAGPAYVAVSDVNGDGKPDLVVANRSVYTVSVLLGNGNGTFQNQTTYATGTQPISISTVDMNGDGKTDLVIANLVSSSVSILLGNGDGTFQDQTTFSLGSGPWSLATPDLNSDGKPDLVGTSGNALLNPGNGSAAGQSYTEVANGDTINGTAAVDQITLSQDIFHQYIDWSLTTPSGTTTNRLSPFDTAGLTINGNGSNDVITLDYTNGNPLPYKLILNGVFTLNGLATTGNTLANRTMDLEKSTLFLNYGSAANDPIALIQDYLKNGYNAGAWTGVAPANDGAIRSSGAAANPLVYSVGYADSADGLVPLPANTIELKYTLNGDTGLSGTVGFTDFMRMTQHYTLTGMTWGQGDFNYDGTVDANDFNLLQPNYGQTLPAAPPVMTPIVAAPVTPTPPQAVSTPPASMDGQVNGSDATKHKKHEKQRHSSNKR